MEDETSTVPESQPIPEPQSAPETQPIPEPESVAEPEPVPESAQPPEEVTHIEAAALEEEPEVTYKGNGIDLTALAALASAALVAGTCMTCNMGFYCLPFLSIILGIVGLVAADSSVNKTRTRLFSWIGIGTGAALVLLIALFVVGYIAFLAIMMATDTLY